MPARQRRVVVRSVDFCQLDMCQDCVARPGFRRTVYTREKFIITPTRLRWGGEGKSADRAVIRVFSVLVGLL